MNKKYLLISSCLILIMGGNGEINRVYATTNSPLHGPQSSDKASSSSSSASLSKESAFKPITPPPPTDSPPPLPTQHNTLSSVQEKPLPALPMQGTNSTSRAAPLNSQPSQTSNTDKPQVDTPSLSSSNPVVNRVRSNATATLPLSAFPKQEPSSGPLTARPLSMPEIEKQTENNQKLETPQGPVASASEGLAMEQIKMLREVREKADVCYDMGRAIAKEAAQDPKKFEEDIKDAERKEDSIFPTYYESIFAKNPKYVSETSDFSKMDEQSFVFYLKEQRKGVSAQVSAMLKKILDWTDISKLEKYRNDISGDLRAMSAYCSQSILELKKAIEYKRTSPTQTNSTSPSQEKKQGFGGKLKNIFTKP